MTKRRNPLVFLDVCIDGDPGEKMVFELFPDVAPYTTENFRALCTGEKGNSSKYGKPLHYKGSFFHRTVKGYLAQVNHLIYLSYDNWFICVVYFFYVMRVAYLLLENDLEDMYALLSVIHVPCLCCRVQG
uniref:Peptidyl-prolyl cis-trans isomerase n=1 Tax=Kalanchoe fedtschenkoi TaxID=63787 RepID=A0A7N0V216_KALFE